MVSSHRINRCALLSTLGLSVNLIWCTLAGHAAGFSSTPEELGLFANSRLFFLLGILLVGAAFAVAPRSLREHDRPLAYILPLASSFGTACFALAARQNLFPPGVLAIAGLIAFGMGYFWIVARYNLLLARTQSFSRATWCIVFALAIEALVLPLFESLVPSVWQIVTAIALPIVSALLFGGARKAAITSSSEELESDAYADGHGETAQPSLPAQPRRRSLVRNPSARRSLAVLVISVSLLLATVRSFSAIGLWGESPSTGSDLLAGLAFWAASSLLLGLFAFAALVKTSHWNLKTRFQPAILVVICGLFLVAAQQSPADTASPVVNELMRLDDSCAHVLFWMVVIAAIDALPQPSYRVMGAAAIAYAACSMVWVFLLGSGTVVNGVIVLVIVYALTVAAMHSEWFGTDREETATEALFSAETAVAQRISSADTDDGISGANGSASLSGRQVSQIITSRCQTLAVEKRLSPRETEIFILLAQGRTRTLIQEELVLAENTVKTHITHIYGKLGVNNRQDMMDLVLGSTSKNHEAAL
ncbi:response regulator transcription factor [Raoultibacter massiliensis]|uniref:Helix-turn-helix transcriptional regulator n=1 Tax=Raoultibacter massiliensis TaxID=1852371 RepID=A0ABV1JE43_9ACTN